MNEYKVVNAGIFRPDKSIFKSSRNDKASCSVVQCCNSENCGLYARGECSWLASIGYQRCPYGKYGKETGFTKRARGYRGWIRDREEKYKEVLHKLKWHSNVMAVVGEYVFLPYPFMTMNEKIPFLAHSGVFRNGNSFLLKEDFTIDNIILICNFIPRAMMGGEIKDYQEKEIRRFLKHLSEQMPDLFKELCLKYERASEIVNNYSYVGREALLHTITPNIGELVDIHNGHWVWDGKYLTSKDSHASFILVDKFSEMRIIPEGKCKIKITDNGQVNKDTIFLT